MSQQNRDVFERCMGLADELVEAKRLPQAEAVLRALQAYLDILPATRDGSCRAKASQKLEEIVTSLRAQMKPKELA